MNVFLQYMSIIFYHGQEQKKLAEETFTEEAKKHSDPVHTKILPATTFHDAEEYALLPELLYAQILCVIMVQKF
jgi:peptide methionine sulfoxide reductase MsrA